MLKGTLMYKDETTVQNDTDMEVQLRPSRLSIKVLCTHHYDGYVLHHC